jgi:uncharacterized protein YndB with AHSA1/START domain
MTTVAERGATIQVYRVYIKATPQAIWDAITKREQAERYGYGSPVEYDLRPGGKFRALASDAMKAHGATDELIVGEVIEVDPPRRLVQTWHPIWDPASAAEAATHLTWEIDPETLHRDGVTMLTVTHDVAGAPLTAKMVSGQVENAGGGWNMVLSDLKTLLETGTSFAACAI